MMIKVNAEDTLDWYILGDQPTTCGLCGARTSFNEEKDGTQNHQCLNRNCNYQFIAVSDEN